jgi:hypothetical protein
MEPMRLLVTDAAAQPPRQATAWLIMTLAKMKTVVKLSLVVAISLAITAGILAVIDVRATVGSGFASVRIPEKEFQSVDLSSIRYMAFWHQEDAESMAIHFKSEDEKYFSAPEKKEDGLYATIRTGSETPGNPFKKSRFYFESYIVITTSESVYLAEIERRSDSYILEMKSVKTIRRLTNRYRQ